MITCDFDAIWQASIKYLGSVSLQPKVKQVLQSFQCFVSS